MVGIVILNYNTPNDVLSCVRSIFEFTKNISFKIYIVDNASQDNSKKIFNQNFSTNPLITILHNNQNQGFSAGNNIGIRRAINDNAEYICVLNADVILLNNAIEEMVKSLNNDSSIGVSAPSILEPYSEKEAQFARCKLTWENYFLEKTRLIKFKKLAQKHPRYLKCDQPFDNDFKFMGMTYGCCYLIRSSILEKNKGLDEAVFLFGEEDILAHQLYKNHYYTLITPKAKIFHNHHSSINKTSQANRVFHLRLSPQIVLRKYAKTNIFKLLILICPFCIDWAIRAIFNKDYRVLFTKYIKKNIEVLRIPLNKG